MLAGRPHFEPNRVASAHSVRVNEVYVSLQGESAHAGKLCTFVRLTGCHLRCTYCDSRFSFYEGDKRDIEEVVTQVLALGAPMVEVTGGEPLLQPGVYPLMEAFLREGLTVLLETSGSIDVRLVPTKVHRIVDWKTPSSGEADRNDVKCFSSMTERDELKFVIGSREDYVWVKDVIARYQLAKKPFGLLYSSVYGKVSNEALAQWLIDDRMPGRFQLQQHKYVWQPEARGV